MRLVKRTIAVSVLLAVAVATGALGAEQAAVAVHGGGVDFSPRVNYAYATLTVSGNGIIFSRSVERGRGLAVGTYDLENRPLPDGLYKWRLELVPDEDGATLNAERRSSEATLRVFPSDNVKLVFEFRDAERSGTSLFMKDLFRDVFRLETPLDVTRLRRLGLVAIGRAFHADLAVAEIGFYR